MTGTKIDSRNYIQNIAGIILLTVGVIAAFIFFYHSNALRITHQNENYIADIANQRGDLMEDLFEENISYIESSAIVFETEFQNYDVDGRNLNVSDDELDAGDVNKVAKILKLYEKRFAFDYLRFIDLKGRDYTTGEKVIAAVVTEREYFKEGSRGKTGMTYILDSKVTSERQIGFYSPVYQNGEQIGIAVGFYGEDFINSLIEISVFDHNCDVMLCAQDGNIIYSTGKENEASNVITELSEFSFSEDKDFANVRKAFEERSNAVYNYKVDDEKTVGVVSYIGGQSDFFLVLNFPAKEYKKMLRNASMNGAWLLLMLIVMFLAAAIFYIARFFIQKKRLIEESKNSNDIHFAMSRLFENFVIVDANTRSYHYIEGMPDVGHIPNDGPYDLFAEDLLKRFPDESERQAAGEMISFEHLTSLMNQGNNIISYNLHAPISEEEWFTYNFIVVSRDDDGNVTEFIIARQDITTLHEKEEQTRRILEKARDDAEKGNRAKSDFLASMSHDIRTPMNAIIGFTNIARDHIDDSEIVSDALRKIQGSSQYLLSLINDVLDMSKIESGNVEINENECDLNQVFERIADITRTQARNKSLDIRFILDGIKDPYVVTDELRLEQILINITGNAVKYTPDGGSITITAEETDGPAEGFSHYTFSVKDTGMGMSEEFLPHIFESFSRATDSKINKIQGTGLGMAITGKLVQLMGGSITVSSRLGEGSEFIVAMDLAHWHSDGPEPSEISETETGSSDISGSRILLVEDNDINAEIATMVLSEYGVEIERASNGREGADLVRSRGEAYYDAVLMDIQMPVMNGYEATKEIRSLGSKYTGELPIIAMSANAYDEDIKASLESGMNGHIAKPFDPGTLVKVLGQMINK